MKSYQETLEFLYNKLPVFSRQGPMAYKEGLDNTYALAEATGNPQHQFRSIHVAGTNGKGSCSHMLAAISQQHGLKTGLYTSPHVIDFRERIRINGIMIPEQWVVEWVHRMIPSLEPIQPSFFELTVAMAYAYFAEQEVDLAIIETGLGGRLDSTNIIQPLLSVITNISLDHTQLLGPDKPSIAREKAGIIKPNTPVIIGESATETDPVFLNKAQETNSQILFADKFYEASLTKWTPEFQEIQLKNTQTNTSEIVVLDLPGRYQLKNLCTVRCALDLLQPELSWNLKDSKIALSRVRSATGIMGRFDVLQKSPLVIADVAHNEAGIRLLMEQINNLNPSGIRIVLGMVKDKDVQTLLQLLPKKADYYITQASIPRALPYNELLTMVRQLGMTARGYPEVKDAFQTALREADTKDLILICGSFFILEPVYASSQRNL